MISRRIPVVAIVVNSTESMVEANNSLKTLQSLQYMAVNVLKHPIVINSLEITREHNRVVVDSEVENNVRALALLFGGGNKELDSTDLSNWLNFSNIIETKPQAVNLLINKGDELSDLDNLNIISLASLLTSHDDLIPAVGQLYSTTGYIPKGIVEATEGDIEPLHFSITNSIFGDLLDDTAESLATFETALAEANDKAVRITESADNDSGMLF